MTEAKNTKSETSKTMRNGSTPEERSKAASELSQSKKTTSTKK